MKKLYTLISLVICLASFNAQTYVTIPDANFVSWLQATVPSAMNGNQMNVNHPDLANRTHLFPTFVNISDLTGIQYFSSLRVLDCTGNYLTFLPPLPISLRDLNCSNNQITSLPLLNTEIYNLNCSFNSISTINSLPDSLKYLNCMGNQITSFPTLPNKINYLTCAHNNLANLPNLPQALKTLDCSYNQVINLPTLPDSLLSLYCHYNNISCFPIFPNTIVNKPNLLQGFYINNNPFDCLPNYISVMDSVTLTYPLCISGNTNGCSVFTEITEISRQLIKLYPNPTNGTFTIEFAIKEKQTVQLFDITGNTVLMQTIDNGKAVIDAGHLAAGIYNISIKGNNSVINQKLVIVK